jgi:hypothetical protein
LKRNESPAQPGTILAGRTLGSDRAGSTEQFVSQVYQQFNLKKETFMKLIGKLVLTSLLITQFAIAQNSSKDLRAVELVTEMKELDQDLAQLNNIRTAGTIFTNGAGEQVIVLSAAAETYILSTSKLSISKQQALGTALGVAGLGEKMIVVTDSETLTKIMHQKRIQISILHEQIADLESSKAHLAAGSASEALIRIKADFEAKAKDLKRQLASLEKIEAQGPKLTNSYGKYLSAAADLFATGLVVNSVSKNPKILAGSLLVTLSAEAAFIHYIDKKAIDQAISQLQSRRLELMERLNNLN